MKLVRDAQRRYEELKQERDDNDGVVPDPNHHCVITLCTDDEFSDPDDIFADQMASLGGDEDVIASRYFPPQPTADLSVGEYQDTQSSRSKKRKPSSARKFRRKNVTESNSRAKTPRPRKKTGDRADKRTSGPRTGFKAKSTAQSTTSSIGMMPI